MRMESLPFFMINKILFLRMLHKNYFQAMVTKLVVLVNDCNKNTHHFIKKKILNKGHYEWSVLPVMSHFDLVDQVVVQFL